jgi:uncharacterized membrane protein HdeD (DUF308 family)
MRFALATNWWSLIIRGLVAILLGIVTFAIPNITLTALVLLFGAYALVDGVVCITGAVRAIEKHERWGSLLFGGLTGVAAAVVTVFWPAMTAVALVFVIGAWAVVTGIFQIVAAVRLRKYIAGEWLLILGGIASVLFGVLITIAPLAGALVIALWVGAYTLVFGVLLIALAFRLRSWEKAAPAGPSITVPAH